MAWDVIKSLQYAAGGVIAFVEAEGHEKLLNFYEQNYFQRFDERISADISGTAHKLIQLLRVIR